MVRNTLAGALWALAVTTSAAAADAPAAEAAPVKKEAPVAKPDDMICTYENVVGTNFPRRVCITREERDARTRNSRQVVEGLQRTTPGSTDKLGGP
jgi:hypothetical protein